MPCQSRHSSVFQTAIESFVAPVLHRFHVQYPNVSFNVRMSSTDEAMEGLTTGAAEIGLVLNPSVRDTIARQEVFRDRMVATFAPNHPLAKRKVVSLRELAEFPFVLTEPSFGLRQQIDRIFHQNAVRPEVFLCHQLAGAGEGGCQHQPAVHVVNAVFGRA
jgi:DNA-binding transcriptional LysR family regulator